MSPRMMKMLCVLSLALNAGFIGMAVYRYGMVSQGARNVPPATLADRLGLDASQKAAWSALEAPFLRELSANWTEIRGLRQTLLDEIFAARPDERRLADLQAGIAALQGEQQKRVIAQLLAEREVLDAGQRAMLKALLAREYGEQVSEAEHLHR